MDAEIRPEWIVATLRAQGVATDLAHAQTHAALLALMLNGGAPAYAKLAFEVEPAGFAAEQRRNAP